VITYDSENVYDTPDFTFNGVDADKVSITVNTNLKIKVDDVGEN